LEERLKDLDLQNNCCEIQKSENQSNLTVSTKEGCGPKRAILPTTMIKFTAL
jgi:hypothetical protein